MQVQRIQIHNYGPISHLDIKLPFDGDTPKPVVLVGENGSGKSILLSHIVNGLIYAKDAAYPQTPEVATDRVYKLRSSDYIKSGSEYYFSRVDFTSGVFMEEMQTRRLKQEYIDIPGEIIGIDARSAWRNMGSDQENSLNSNIRTQALKAVREMFSNSCILYFPPNRFEEPAWLNEESLQAKAHHMDLIYMEGSTSRKIISHSPLHNNQNWLFDVLYDRLAFEIQTRPMSFYDGSPAVVVESYGGSATSAFDTALSIIQTVMRQDDIIYRIGWRRDRAVGIYSQIELVPNIFQLSSGETALLNLFLSILRDRDLCDTPFSGTMDIRGVVVVDEIDLHLHAVHQYDVLPALIRMFPNIQFVVTTHSPLFILGMRKLFGEDGFALYSLPDGRQLNTEDFSEFGNAYRAFVNTVKFSDDMHKKIESIQKPIVLVEGKTDQLYLQTGLRLLGCDATLERIEIIDVGGADNLSKIWNAREAFFRIAPQKLMLLYDCDYGKRITAAAKDKLRRHVIPLQLANPVKTGIENLFTKETLAKAQKHKPALIDIIEAHNGTERGEDVRIPEQWTINEDEKMNLCNWLCEHGTAEDFAGFSVVVHILEEFLGAGDATG